MKKGKESFLLIETLPPFATKHILNFDFVVLGFFLDPTFLDLQVHRFPKFKLADSQISGFPDAADNVGGHTLRSHFDPSRNAPRDQMRRKEPSLRSLVAILQPQRAIC